MNDLNLAAETAKETSHCLKMRYRDIQTILRSENWYDSINEYLKQFPITEDKFGIIVTNEVLRYSASRRTTEWYNLRSRLQALLSPEEYERICVGMTSLSGNYKSEHE